MKSKPTELVHVRDGGEAVSSTMSDWTAQRIVNKVISPEMGFKQKEKAVFVGFVSLLKAFGFEIVDAKSLTIREIVSIVKNETDALLKEVSQ
jgi:hypothetical protein